MGSRVVGLVKIMFSSWWKLKQNYRLKQVADELMRHDDP